MSQKASTCAIDALGHGIRAGKDRRLANGAPRFHSKTRRAAFRIGDGTDRVRCQGESIVLPSIGSVRGRDGNHCACAVDGLVNIVGRPWVAQPSG